MKSVAVFATTLLFSTLLFSQSPDCNTISVTTSSGSIIVSGVNAAPIVGVQVFNNNWVSVFSQTYTSHGDVINVSPIPAGQYIVNVRFYNSNWSSICEKGTNVTVSDSPPPQDTCSTTFQKSYGNISADEWAIDLVKSSDGGYAAAGLATATGNTNHDALLMKFNSNGNLMWSKTYGGGQEDYFYDLVATI